jgi:hypothetical protein
MSELSQYPTLTDNQRIQAREQAHDNLVRKLGGEPRLEDFERHVHKPFGARAEPVGMLLAIIVLAAAFIISAVHVYGVGYRTYLEGSQNDRTAILIGVAFVILAESSVLALSVLPTLWATPNAVTNWMRVGVLASAFIATIGNIDATIFYSAQPFNWIKAWWSTLATAPNEWALATLPPFLTVLVGMGLKYQILSHNRQRQEAKEAHRQALDEWRQTIDTLEEHPRWRLTWFNALWDEWRKNKPTPLLESIDRETRLAIVLREMEDEARLSRELNSLEFSTNAAKASAWTGKNKQEIVREFLEDHPEFIHADQSELAAIILNATGIRISQSTVSRGMMAAHTNGHGGSED